VTGEDAIELPIDAVSVVQVRGAAFAPEFGLSAGAVTTSNAASRDAWHVTVNDLEPRPRGARASSEASNRGAAVHVGGRSSRARSLPRVGPVRI